MKVAILGSGDVGQTLGRGFLEAGHEVKMGTRHPQKEAVTAWLNEAGPGASAGSFEEAAQFGDMAVLATLWTGTENAIQLARPQNLADKLVIDTTNPLDFSAGMPPRLTLGGGDSAGEQVQRWLPRSRVVKAYNTVGFPHMIDPEFPGGPPDMFICGNDTEAKTTTAGLLERFGWSAIDIGGIEASRYLEPLAMIWITLYFVNNNADHAFKVLRK